MKKNIMFGLFIVCGSLHAQDTQPNWKQHFPEQWNTQIIKLGDTAQRLFLKATLGIALLVQEKKVVVLGEGGYFKHKGVTCGFFPTKTQGTTLTGWAACFGDNGLKYSEATAECGLKQKFIKAGSAYDSYSFTTKKGVTKTCNVYVA